MKLRKRKQPRRSTVLLFAFTIFILGLFVTGYNYLVSKKNKIYTSMNLLLYEDEMPEEVNDVVPDEKVEEKEEELEQSPVEETPVKDNVSNKKVTYNYIGTLKISAINLKRGFLNIDSPYNNVSRNVTVVKESIFPDEENSHLILVAHSGNCVVCYFDKLYKLEKGNTAVVNYKNKDYTYKLVNIYNVEKTGQVEIKRDPNKDTLTLITCTHNSDHEQTVYIFELVE